MESIPGVPSVTREQLNDSKSPVIIHSAVWLHVVATLCLILRLLSRGIKGMRLGLDDWLIIAAQVVGYGHAALIITMAAHGAGQHTMAVITRPNAAHLIDVQLKCGFATAPLTTLHLSLVKASALALYLRIFPQRHIRLGVHILGAIIAAYFVAFIFLVIFGCDPVSRGWADNGTTCLAKSRAVNTAGTVCDTIINSLILALPVPSIVRLRIRTWQKAAITGLFLLGGLSTASAWIRWWGVEEYRESPNADQMYFSYKALVFLVLEMATGVMGVSLCTITPILSYFTLRLGLKRASMALNKADVAGLVTIGGSDGSLEGPASRPNSRPHLFGRLQSENNTSVDEREPSPGPTSGTA